MEKIQDNKVYFYDGSNYQIVDSSSIDDSLVGHWVVATLTTSADGGTMLSDMRLFQPQISVEIEMVDDRNVRLKDDEYSYDGSDYVPSSKFEIGYEITIKSKVPGISDIDLVAMQEDPSMTVTLENLEITPRTDSIPVGREAEKYQMCLGRLYCLGKQKLVKALSGPGCGTLLIRKTLV